MITLDDIYEALRLKHRRNAESIIDSLAEAATILLYDKDYDGHGREEIKDALDQAKDLQTRLRALQLKAIEDHLKP